MTGNKHPESWSLRRFRPRGRRALWILIGCIGGLVALAPAASGVTHLSYSDDFDRTDLGSDWIVDSLNFSIAADELYSDSGVAFGSAQLRWADATNTINQYSKLQVTSEQTHSWGFIFRAGTVPGDHYQIHLPQGMSMWRWERYDPGFVRRVGECRGDETLDDGDWIGATIGGTGPGTVVRVWRWDADPDGGGPVDIAQNWGAADCEILEDPQFPLDTGLQIGIRAFTGSSIVTASADNWSGGDMPPPPVCGDGIPEGGEECDESGETASCDADCTFPECGDGLLNVSASEICESDADCAVDEVCLSDCSCVPAPVCGDDQLEPPEQCDDGNLLPGDGCDEDCFTEECGNGVLQFGEECDDGNLQPGDGCDELCVQEPLPPGYADDFNRLELGSNWVVDSFNFGIFSNMLVSNSAVLNQVVQMRWVGGDTATLNQYGKLQVIDQQTHTWGFIFRSSGTPGAHYEVHLPPGSLDWRWERYDPDYQERVSTCVSDSTVDDGDWLGATIEGTGNDTIVRVWRWDADPDLGGVADIEQNWGTPICVMTQDPLVAVDTGRTLGLRAYTGGSTAWSTADNWSGGDCGTGTDQETCGNGAPSTSIVQIIDNSGIGVTNSLVDPDGLALDADGNVFIAACGLAPQNVGVFKVTPAGAISKIIGYYADDAGHILDCPVGIETDSLGNVYVAGYLSDNVFRWTAADDTVALIADKTGDGAGNLLDGALGVAIDAADNVYVTGFFSENAFKIVPGVSITKIIDGTGDGTNSLANPFGVAVDSAANVYVVGFSSHNVFQIPSAGPIVEIMNQSGDGTPGGNLLSPHDITVDSAGNVYVTGNQSDNVFKISAGPTIEIIADLNGDGVHPMDNPTGIAVTDSGVVYVVAFESENAFEILPSGAKVQIINGTGDGQHGFRGPSDFCVDLDDSGNVFLAGTASDNVYRLERDCGGGPGSCEDDLDGVPNDVDNCPFIFNPDQTDTDSDGAGDVCDSDDDDDGFLDGQDCSPQDPGVWAAPEPVQALVLYHFLAPLESTSLEWQAPANRGAESVAYDILRSTTPDYFDAATCVELDGLDTTSEDMDEPAAGAAFYYLIRVENSCPLSNMGTDSSGTPRSATACP